MKRKGIVAILDSLAAYIVAFTAIGLIALLMTNSQEPEIKTSRTLNVWAEDIADAIGMSMVDPTNYDKAWFKDTDPTIKSDLKTSLDNIADARGLIIYFDIDGVDYTTNLDDIDDAKEVATATRYLKDFTVAAAPGSPYVPTGELLKLTVKIGK